ncbi:hypothetical protein BFP72_00095 [Reichenbachiella sp. 5M10]|uniref:DUF4421 domain-containing protein n=1 Tax=Reichenbachiella sp. 5M10 TaxID=1889772 RepID=UPI000C14A2F9|nr:DUF4421 domain-containing protein [Reichenbachiella sp. 5M10]PIB33944.1 hypothetical protein BFP72_00095 [Reichenbachiella sp. 5M10]
MSRISCTFLFLFLSSTLWAQETPLDTANLNYDPHYIIDYSDKLSIRVLNVIKFSQVLHHDDSTGKSIIYRPNENVNIGFGVSTEWLSLAASFGMPFLNNDNDIFGKTTALDFTSSIYLRKVAIDLLFQFYQGFFLANPQDLIPGYSSSQYPTRRDLTTLNMGTSAVYIFNHKRFSYRAAYTQSERQFKSAGSFLAGLYINAYRMEADSSLIPSDLIYANPNNDFRDINFYNLGITGGYAYTAVIYHKIYVSASLTIGLGPQIERARATDIREGYNRTILDTSATAKLALGYNGKRAFGGVSWYGLATGTKHENEAYLQRSTNNIRLYFGMRFHKPKFLSNSRMF